MEKEPEKDKDLAEEKDSNVLSPDEIVRNNLDSPSSTQEHDKVDDDHDLLSRITVRKFRQSDVDDFMSWARDPELGRFTNWKSPASIEEANNMVAFRRGGHRWHRSICLNERSIGEVSMTPTDSARRAEIMFWLGRDYRGKGIVTHVVKLVSKSVFVDSRPMRRDLERLEAFADVENLASQRVLEKAGFVREGVLRKYYLINGVTRDTIVYSLLSTECAI